MLELPEIDRKSAVPANLQVAAELRRRIRRGDYQPGERLPSVEDIIQATGIADVTARKALRVLRDEGLAELSPGMGYYVPAELPGQPGGK